MKAVLVIDMPNSCFHCKLDQYGHLCGATLKNNDGNANKRPSWCPLRPMPEQMSWGHTADYIEGYNACLEEITK